MTQRLVVCLFGSALLGAGAAIWSVAAGLGVLLALLAYSGTSSVSLFTLALATMPRERTAHRPALLPAPRGHTA